MIYKVSVIVPIYKVESYLNRCVDSIINQTYSNIEIILVNDGSPDNCGNIIDEYAKTDSRIKVAHKQNGGLSDARNYGMQYVTGEFTLYVDSDDWLERKMIEKMVDKSLEFNADAVQIAFYYAYDDYLLFDNRYDPKSSDPVVLNNKSLMFELVVNERVKNFAWGKLYKTDIIRNIPFDRGVLFEDVFWAHKVMHRVNTYVILNEPMYYYYQRSDSIVATYSLRNLDIIRGLQERHTFIEEFYDNLINNSYKIILEINLAHYTLLLTNRKIDKGGLSRKAIEIYIKNNYSKLKQAVEYDKELKQQLQLFIIHPYVNILFLVLKKVLRKLKIIPQPVGLERVNF
jgi:glycosyltransferase involved in cell wall biosynthesis